MLAVAVACQGETDPVAARLAKLARKVGDSGQTVRAYLLYAEAAARDPQNVSYRSNRDALEPAAKLLTKAKIENPDISQDILDAKNQPASAGPPIERAKLQDWQTDEQLQPPVKLQLVDHSKHDFDLRADPRSLLRQVADAYGVQSLEDKDIKPGAPIHFELTNADFHTALEAVTDATDTFVFPVSRKAVYFAPNTELKRQQLEPVVISTFSLQEALTERDLIEAVNAVRGVLSLRTVGWDSVNRTVMIRDRMTRTRVARSLLEALLLPPAQVSFEVQFLTFDTDRSYHYGASLQTAFQIMNFGNIGGFKNVLQPSLNATNFLPWGKGATLFGVGLADAMAFASYSQSFTQVIYDATVVVADRQTVTFHVGDQYPIPTSLYTGFSQGLPSIYNPAPQISMEDLGLVLKMMPHVTGNGIIDLQLESDFKSLGTQTFNSVPTVAERAFKGNVSLREGQWAIIGGLNSSQRSVSRDGLAGLTQVPGLKQVLSENTRDNQTSDTLVVIKPTLTRLPMSNVISPQYLLGPLHGERVLL